MQYNVGMLTTQRIALVLTITNKQETPSLQHAAYARSVWNWGVAQSRRALDPGKPLNVRTYACDCGMVLDRDLNAARNLARYAAGSSSEAQNGRGGHVRPSSGGSGRRSVNGSTGLNRSGQMVGIRSDF